ncbi:hypothetical protein MSA92_03695 [bacterium]|nr:hypothetical protein [bacterium]MDY2885333.1 hypothetical protein [Bariatricus sp.]
MLLKDYFAERVQTANLCQPYRIFKEGKEVEENDYMDLECFVISGTLEDIIFLKEKGNAMDGIWELDLDVTLKQKEMEINYLLLHTDLTEEELKKGSKLCRLEETAKKWGNQQESLYLFHETCQLLEFDYKKAIEIRREKEILDILKEAQDEHGSLFVVRGDAGETYYALSKEDAYVWDSAEKIIRSVSQNHLPLHIREDIQELKEKREPR